MPRPPYFPTALNLAGRKAQVIGDDADAVEKAVRLARSGANVTAIGRFTVASLRTLTSAGVSVSTRKPAAAAVAPDSFLVVLSAKDDAGLAARLQSECRKNRILFCAIDQPDYCDFVNLSVFEQGELQISVGTGGASPSVARKIRLGLEASFADGQLGRFINRLRAIRDELTSGHRSPADRRKRLIDATKGFEFRAKARVPRVGAPKRTRKRRTQ